MTSAITITKRSICLATTVSALVFSMAFLPRAVAQSYDDPPGRVARLAYIEGSVSFEPAGESDWVQAGLNRPMTTGDKIWADRDSRAELQLGSARIDISSDTGVSFFNLTSQYLEAVTNHSR